jgi:hypothetical protein
LQKEKRKKKLNFESIGCTVFQGYYLENRWILMLLNQNTSQKVWRGRSNMMQPSITIKSETVEEAVKTALSILGAQMDEVSIAVLSTPSKGIFGRTKQFAEVTITN